MFPPRPGQCAYVIDGAHTEFLVTEYTDRLFIVVTQIGKLGTVFHLSRSQTAELSRALAVDGVNDLADDALSSMDAVVARTLIGRRDDETLRACARRIGEVLFSKGYEKPVLCALGLRPAASLEAKRAVASLAAERAAELILAGAC